MENLNIVEFGSETKKKIEYASNLYYMVAFEYAMTDNIIYVANKLNIDAREIENLLDTKNFQKQVDRVKNDIKNSGGDPFKLQLSIDRLKALDELRGIAFGAESKDKLKALDMIFNMTKDLGQKEIKKDDINSNQLVTFNIKKEKKDE